MAVGIYLAHLFYVDLAHMAGRAIHHWAFEVAAPVLGMARWKPTRRFVR